MNLLIRADSSSSIGLGHIMRDLVLAGRYPEASILFACRDLPGNMIERIPYPVHILSTDEPQELINLIRTRHIDMVIFDHYGIDEAFERKIKDATGVKVLALDDTYASHHCDILLNPNLYADASRYASLVPKGCELRCGKPFLLVRQEFYDVAQRPKADSHSIFVSLGGSDPANLSMKVLGALGSDLPIECVTTTANKALEHLKAYASAHPNVRLHVNAANIAELMHASRCAIITPSSIAHEAIAAGIPFVAIQSAPNQNEFVRYLKANGYPVIETFDPALLERALVELLQ